jgi:hypothetical protein
MNATENYGQNFKGSSKKLAPRAIRQLVNHARNKQISSKTLKSDLNLSVSESTIQRTLKSNKLKYAKMKAQPKLKKIHKVKRLEFCRNNMARVWENIWFSDEKKFNLDGPDGFAYYWHDIRHKKRTFSKRQGGGSGVTIWAAISSKGKSLIMFIDGYMDSNQYQNILTNGLLPIYNQFEIFQQDNARPHVSRASLQWLRDQQVNVIDWPSVSPDLNPIENVWGLLTRVIYKDGQQYNNIEMLKLAIQRAWSNLPQSSINNLISTMPSRIFDCIRKAECCVSK